MQKKVLALHDLSGFGRSSLVPIIAAISAAGHQCVPLPTAYFSTHMAIPGWETVDLTGVMPRVIDQYDRLGHRRSRRRQRPAEPAARKRSLRS